MKGNETQYDFRGLFSFMIDITLKLQANNNDNFVYLFSSWILEYLLIFIYLCAVYFQLFPLFLLPVVLIFFLKHFLLLCIFAVSVFQFSLFNDTCIHKQTTTQVSARINGFEFFLFQSSTIYIFIIFIFLFISFSCAWSCGV